MSSTSEDYDFAPANNSCSNNVNKTIIVPALGSPSNNTQTHIDAMQAQHVEDSKYDSPQLNVQPLYGGKKNLKIYNIYFRKKIYTVTNSNKLNALKIFFKNKIYKKDHLVKISNNNKTSFYILHIGSLDYVSNKKKIKFINITNV